MSSHSLFFLIDVHVDNLMNREEHIMYEYTVSIDLDQGSVIAGSDEEALETVKELINQDAYTVLIVDKIEVSS